MFTSTGDGIYDVENPDTSASSEDENGRDSESDEISKMELLEQVPFDYENEVNYMSDKEL